MWRAYLDESEPYGCPDTYILAAALVHDDDAENLRHTLKAIKPASDHKLHWNHESAPSRIKITHTLAETGLLHVVVVRHGPTGDPSERARRKCLQQMAFELNDHDVSTIVAEAREGKANARELKLFNQLRTAKQIDHRMRMDHVPGPEEPLLWVADAVAGAVGAHQRGQDDYFAILAQNVDVITIDARP